MKRARLFTATMVSMTLVAAFLAAPMPAAAVGATVSMTSCNGTFCFQPSTINVPTGAGVTWTNSSGTTHTATSDAAGGWDTGFVSNGSSAAVSFPTAGIYPYHCTIHPYMHGTVFVGVTPQIALPSVTNRAYGGYTTAAYVENTGAAAASVHVRYFDRSGNPVGTGDDLASLPAHASWTVRQDNGNSFSPGVAGSAIVYSFQPVAAFVNDFAPGGGDASSYTGMRIGSDNGPRLFAPTIVNNAYGGYTTGLGILNVGDATDIQIVYRDAAGTVVKTQTLTTVPPHAYRDAYSGTAGLPDQFVGTATITVLNPLPAASSVAVVVNEVGPNGQFGSYDAVSNASMVWNAPIALNAGFGGYYTGINVQNTSTSPGTVSITYYDSAGNVAKASSTPIAGSGYAPIYQGDGTLGPPPSSAGYSALLTADVPVTAEVNEVAPAAVGSGPGRQLTSYTPSSGNVSVNAPLVENSGADGWSTGADIMNTGIAASITIKYFDAATGVALQTKTVNLASHAFLGDYTPDDLPAGTRATALITGALMSPVAVIVNEGSATSFMSYGGQ